MKKPLKIVQCNDDKFIVQRKGWFGWTTMVEIYDGNWGWHYRWSYFMKPDGGGCYDRFDSVRAALDQLGSYYHGRRKLQVKT